MALTNLHEFINNIGIVPGILLVFILNISKTLVSTGRLRLMFKMNINLPVPHQSTTNTVQYRLSGA